MARSAFSRSFLASLRYMKTVMNGAWPLVVMRVTTWYWMVWTPRAISSRTRPSTIWEIFSSPGWASMASISASTWRRIF